MPRKKVTTAAAVEEQHPIVEENVQEIVVSETVVSEPEEVEVEQKVASEEPKTEEKVAEIVPETDEKVEEKVEEPVTEKVEEKEEKKPREHHKNQSMGYYWNGQMFGGGINY